MASEVWRAAGIAAVAHKNQYRDDLITPYFVHPARVAMILVHEFGVIDEEIIIAAYLQDVVEDINHCSLEDIRVMFDDLVAFYVGELTRDKSLPKPQRDNIYYGGLREAGPSVLLIKAADSLDNLRDSTPKKYKGAREKVYRVLGLMDRASNHETIIAMNLLEYELANTSG